MLVADAVIRMADGLQRDFALLVRQWNQLATRVLFRGATFVGIYVGIVAAQNCVIAAIQSLQAQHIGARPVEGEKDVDVRSEMLFEFLGCRPCVRVVTIGAHVALVGAGNGFENFWVYSGVVIAGKAASRFGEGLRHREII